MLRNLVRHVAFIAVFGSLVACASRSLYLEAGKSFSKGYDSASGVIQQDLDRVTRVRRILSVMQYLDNGSRESNIDPTKINDSFVRFVCAGAGEYQNQWASLTVLQTYRKLISDLSERPSGDVGAVWRSTSDLREPQKPLGLPPIDPNAYMTCIKHIGKLVPPRGEDLVRPEKLAAIPAILAIYASIKQLIDTVGPPLFRAIDEAARTVTLKKLVQENRELINTILDHHLSGKDLDEALERRRRAALVLPYVQFKTMLAISRSTKSVEIVETAMNVHEKLAEFDALRERRDPSKLLEAMKNAQKDLERLADEQLTAGQAWANLAAFAELTTELLRAVQAAQGEVQQIRRALSQ